MLAIEKVIDYGTFSYRRDSRNQNIEQDVAFGDLMSDSDEATEQQETNSVHFMRKADVLTGNVIEVDSYSRVGRILMLIPDIGKNLDVTA